LFDRFDVAQSQRGSIAASIRSDSTGPHVTRRQLAPAGRWSPPSVSLVLPTRFG